MTNVTVGSILLHGIQSGAGRVCVSGFGEPEGRHARRDVAEATANDVARL